jgi:hypothetical protein
VDATYSRVGIKIRANPSNLYCLNRVAIVLAVPPMADLSTAKTSRSSGVWDEMKRTIVWTEEALEPGRAIEIQAQFNIIDSMSSSSNSFPVLVRCEFPALFSSVEVVEESQSDRDVPVDIRVFPSGRVLHRKV